MHARPAAAVGTAVTASALLRPLRDELAVRCGTDAVSVIFVTTVAVLALVTTAGAIAARKPGRFRVLPDALRAALTLATLLLGWLACGAGATRLSGAAFVVGHAVVTVLVIASAWQSVAERAGDAGRGRAVGAAAIGAGVGAILGPLVASLLVAGPGPRWLAPVAAVFLGGAFLSTRRRAHARPPATPQPAANLALEPPARTPAVRRVALLVGGWSVVSTVIYFAQVDIAADQLTDPGARIQWFASLDLAANAIALLVQIGTARWIARRLRISTVLAVGPALVAAGFVAIWIWPDVGVLAAVTVIGRAGGTAMFRPARELLLASAGRPIETHTRCAIDGLVYRAADAATAASIGVVPGGTSSVGVLALFGTTAALALAVAGLGIGRIHDEHHFNPARNAFATNVREAARREHVDPRMPGGARCLGTGLDHATHSLDGRTAARRRARHLADVRRRRGRARSDP